MLTMRARRRSITGMVFVTLLAAAPAFADPALVKEPTEIVQPRELAERVAIRDLTVAADGTVSGTVCNISKEPVRDVRLLVDRSALRARLAAVSPEPMPVWRFTAGTDCTSASGVRRW